jgi:hypothetical protein
MGCLMRWYKFQSQEDFDVWHEALKKQLGYPLPSYDINGNLVGEPYTTDYTSVVKIAENDFRTIIDQEYAQGLTPCDAPEIKDEREIINPQS